MPSTLETTLPDGREVTVTYRAYPPERGARGRYGVPIEPDYGPEIEIEDVTEDGVSVDWSDAEADFLYERIEADIESYSEG